MQIEKKYANGLLNADDDFSLVAPNEYVNASGLRFGSTDDGSTMRFEKVRGTTSVFSSFDAGTGSASFEMVGQVEDRARQRILWFVFHNDPVARHGIYCFDRREQVGYTVLKNNQVTGGLGIEQGRYIHSAEIWGDLLFWTTGEGETKVINIESGIKLNHPSYVTNQKAYTSPLAQEDISLIKRPPMLAPLTIKKYDGLAGFNFLQEDAFQFSFQYEYYDNQESVLGPWTDVVGIPGADELYNRICVILPKEERIPKTVRIVSLYVKSLRNNVVYRVRKWDKEIATEAVFLELHESEQAPLWVDFFNNEAGKYLAESVFAKQEELVPRTSETLCVSDNRLFLSNALFGFNSPARTSLLGQANLSATLNGLISSVPVVRFDIPFERYTVTGGTFTSESRFFRGYFVMLTGVSPAGYYLVLPAFAEQTGSYPTVAEPTNTPFYTGKVANFVYFGESVSDAVDYLGAFLGYRAEANTVNVTTGFTAINVGPVEYPAAKCFKSNSGYQYSVAFMDRFGRTIGLCQQVLTIQIPALQFGTNQFTGTISWQLDNTNALNEIPEEAYYYSIVKTLNLRTKNFIQGFDAEWRYAVKAPNGTYTFQTAAAGGQYLAIDLASLGRSVGYVFNEGDLCSVTTSTNANFNLKVIAVVGSYLLLTYEDIGNSTGTAIRFEVFTPSKASEFEFFYEFGRRYKIQNASTPTREYSRLSGYLDGDTFITKRRAPNSISAYYSEAMCASDNFWKLWFEGRGRTFANVRNTAEKDTGVIVWSNTYFIGTEVNGSSSFEINNRQQLAIEAGPIRMLINASTLQEEGNVMLAIGERETLSLYVGQAQITDEKQFNLLLKTDTVIGTVNGLRGSYGTLHPESVVRHRGNVYWFDVLNGCFVRYGNNGLFDVSGYKFKRFASQLAKRMQIKNTGTNIATGFRNKIVGGVDVWHEEVLWTIPKVFDTPPKGNLSDYSSPNVAYPYDIFDGVSKTIVFKINADKWMGSLPFVADGFGRINNELYSFRNGVLHQHNVGDFCTFYGTAVAPRIAFVFNSEPSVVKTYRAVSLEVNQAPVWSHFRTEYPNIQSTELVAAEWKRKESVWYASLFNDRLSPNASGSVDQKMIKGDPMRGQYLLAVFEFAAGGDQLNFRIANISFNPSYGHKV